MKKETDLKPEETMLHSDGRGVYYDMNGNMMRCSKCECVVFVRSGDRFEYCPKCGRKAKR